jgi:pyruvate-formate lyase-activating enzyme
VQISSDDTPRRKAEKLVALQSETKQALATGEPCACSGCQELEERDDWRGVKSLNIAFKNQCNLKCCYCRSPREEEGPIDLHDLKEVLTELEKAGLISQETQVRLGSGEITIHSKREMILDAVSKYSPLVYSNCVLFDDKLAEVLGIGRGILNCSLDAGTRETYAKVKGIDCFEQVCDNLQRYAAVGKIELKYIFMPGINDDDEDIKAFARLASKLKPVNAVISRDVHQAKPLNEQAVETLQKLCDLLKEYGVKIREIYGAFREDELS